MKNLFLLGLGALMLLLTSCRESQSPKDANPPPPPPPPMFVEDSVAKMLYGQYEKSWMPTLMPEGELDFGLLDTVYTSNWLQKYQMVVFADRTFLGGFHDSKPGRAYEGLGVQSSWLIKGADRDKLELTYELYLPQEGYDPVEGMEDATPPEPQPVEIIVNQYQIDQLTPNFLQITGLNGGDSARSLQFVGQDSFQIQVEKVQRGWLERMNCTDFGELTTVGEVVYKDERPFTGQTLLFGQWQRITLYNYKAGKLNGTSKYWYVTSGLPSYEQDYVDGIKEGPYIAWWENGKVNSEGAYQAGKKSGLWKMYFDTGQLSEEGAYKNGIREGKHTKYQLGGGIFEEVEYENGKPRS